MLVDSTANVERHWSDWATSRGLDVARILSVVHGRRAIDTIREQAPHLDAERELAALVEAESHETSGITVIPGAAELLASIPDERWAIVTSGPHPVALARLRTAGLPVPAVLITAARVKAGKPDPEGYLAGARALGFAPDRCIVVEDAPAGVEAARRGGMPCIAVLTTHREEDLRGATVVTRELRGIVAEPAKPSGLIVSVRL